MNTLIKTLSEHHWQMSSEKFESKTEDLNEKKEENRIKTLIGKKNAQVKKVGQSGSWSFYIVKTLTNFFRVTYNADTNKFYLTPTTPLTSFVVPTDMNE